MPLKLSPVAYAIIAALLFSAPILAVKIYADAHPPMTPAISVQH